MNLSEAKRKLWEAHDDYLKDELDLAIEKVFEQLNGLGKGQKNLIDSRRKWKKRYYKERRKVKQFKKIQRKVEAVKVICRCKYEDKMLDSMMKHILQMLEGDKQNEQE